MKRPENLRVDARGGTVSLVDRHPIKKDKELELAVFELERVGADSTETANNA